MPTHVLCAYNRSPISIVKGSGVDVWDDQGKQYLDFVGGVAVLALGHCPEVLVRALEKQARTLWTASNMVQVPDQERLAQRLVDATFADAVFFNNSGSEAIDLALKLVRKCVNGRNQGGRYKVIATHNAFHGRTLAAISAGGQEKLRKGYEPLVDGFVHVPFNDLPAMSAAIDEQTAAIIVEPVQGDGGLAVASAEYLQGLRALADEHGLLLIFDEVQTGIGRTGKFFAHEWAGVAPDILAVGKGLGSGYPLGAVLTTAVVGQHITPGSHGSTLGGAPLAMAIGNAVLDVVLEQGFLEQVVSTGSALKRGLDTLVEGYPKVFSEARGVGLMQGLVCVNGNQPVIQKALALGLFIAPAANGVVRLLPPLIVTNEQIEQALAMLEQVAQSLNTEQGK